MQAQDVVVVGRIGAPYGVQGWVRVNSFTEPAGNLADYQPWLLEINDGWRTQHPVEIKLHKQGYVARFAEIRDRNQAARLSGKHVAVARSQLPGLAPGEYYWRDLEGVAVWNRGVQLGVVDHLIDTGANPVLVILGNGVGNGVGNGEGNGVGSKETAETLIPFVDEFVVQVDLTAGRIDVDWVGLDEAD